jgi:hypothetical protein
LELTRFRGHGLLGSWVLFVVGWAAVSEALLDALGVVEAFDVVEQYGSEAGAGRPVLGGMDPGELAFEGGEERLDGQLPFLNGADVTTEGAADAMEMFRPVLPANLLGLPSVCVPAAGDTDSGLPIGVLVTGARYTESVCLDAAEIVEGLTSTHPDRPARLIDLGRNNIASA